MHIELFQVKFLQLSLQLHTVSHTQLCKQMEPSIKTRSRIRRTAEVNAALRLDTRAQK